MARGLIQNTRDVIHEKNILAAIDLSLILLIAQMRILFIMNVFRSFLVGTMIWLAWLVLRDMPTSRAVALPGEAKS